MILAIALAASVHAAPASKITVLKTTPADVAAFYHQDPLTKQRIEYAKTLYDADPKGFCAGVMVTEVIEQHFTAVRAHIPDDARWLSATVTFIGDKGQTLIRCTSSPDFDTGMGLTPHKEPAK